MLADAPQFLIDLGTVAGSITAVLVFIGLVSRLRPVKYVWRKLVSGPFADWFKSHIDEAVQPIKDEMTPNGGESIKDQVNSLHKGQAQIRDQVTKAITDHEKREMGIIESLDERVTDVESEMSTIHRLAVRIGRWTHQFEQFEPVKLHDLDLRAEQDEIDQDLLEADPPEER